MTSQQERLSSSRDYQIEAEHTRRRLAEHLDELSDRLTPGQVFDEMLSYTRAGSGTFFRAFSNAMRENPIPSLLIGAGCMMFLSEKMGLRPGGFGNGGGSRAMRAADEMRASEGYDPYRAAAATPNVPAGRAMRPAAMRDAAGGWAMRRPDDGDGDFDRKVGGCLVAGRRQANDRRRGPTGGRSGRLSEAGRGGRRRHHGRGYRGGPFNHLWTA